MPPRRYRIVLNARSGAASDGALTPDRLLSLFHDAGLEATVDADLDAPLSERIAAAVAGEADTIVAAGGDGTVTAIAAALVGTTKVLAVLPLGTANLLARDLGIPLELGAAIDSLASMQPHRVDVGDMNGRVFLHKVVIGFAPEVAAGREVMRERKGIAPRLAFLRFFLKHVMRPRRLSIEMVSEDGSQRTERVRSIAVANNAYDEGFGRVFARRRLDRGFLSVYLIRRFGLSDLVSLSLGMVFGRWRGHEGLTIEAVQGIELRSRHRVLPIMIDGEVEPVETPLAFVIRPRALAVLCPVDAGESAPEDLREAAAPAMATA